MLRQTVAVFFVLLLLAATLWLLRRRGLATVNTVIAKRLSKQKLMQVVERVPLTANHSLHLVRIQDRVILIGVSPSGCHQIDSFAAPLVPVSPQEKQ
jgi:flagellar biosynthetic protein FliO